MKVYKFHIKGNTNGGDLSKSAVTVYPKEKDREESVIITQRTLTKDTGAILIGFRIVKTFKDWYLMERTSSHKTETFLDIADHVKLCREIIDIESRENM